MIAVDRSVSILGTSALRRELKFLQIKHSECLSAAQKSFSIPIFHCGNSFIRGFFPLPCICMPLQSSVGIRGRPFGVLEQGIKARVPLQLHSASGSALLPATAAQSTIKPFTNSTQPNSLDMRFLEFLAALATFTAVLAVPFPGPVTDKGKY
jgi:hypothetical protein